MIIGVGNDIIEPERIEKACERHAFFVNTFTEKERELIEKHKSAAAGNWCVKEAVVKCFGTGFAGCSPNEVEVLRDEKGKPYVNLYGKADKLAESLGIGKIFVSISDTKTLVSAVAVAEAKEIDK